MHLDAVTVLDLIGTYVFALSGGLVALRRRMDVIGVLTLGLVTSVAGGVARDLLIGDLPPQIVRNDGRLLLPVAAAATVVAVPGFLDRLRHPVLLLDAIGLGLFASVGATTALREGLGVPATILVGTVSAVGGGLVRDLLADQIPQILAEGSRLYAIPAALGALIVVIGDQAALAPTAIQIAAVTVTVVVRLLALRYGWHVPVRRITTPTRSGEQS